MTVIPTQEILEYGQVLATTQATTVTANASANTKGNYAQITSGLTHDIWALQIGMLPSSSADDYLLDIAIGSAGNEVVIVSDIHFPSTQNAFDTIKFPFYIPAGTRIAVRIQATTGGVTGTVIIQGLAPGDFGLYPPVEHCDTYGDNTTTSGGVSVDPGGTINTVGSYSQLTSSTTNPIRMLLIDIGCQKNTAPSSFRWEVNIAIGGAGSERNIISFHLQGGTSGSQGGPRPAHMEFEIFIPAGTRLSANAQCSGNDATDRLLALVVHGLT